MVKIFVEGGGDSSSLKSECRRAFSTFFEKAGLKGQMPRIVACGPRNDAFDAFCTAMKQGETAFLLVDSEDKIDSAWQAGSEFINWQPWAHLQHKDGWDKPVQAEDSQCHLMVQCMENWFLADPKTLENHFGTSFNSDAIPSNPNSIEAISTKDALDCLRKATKDCPAGTYNKGKHSFKLLAKLDPSKVREKSGWANRLIHGLFRVRV